MSFDYENKKLKISDLNLIIGKNWSEQGVKNKVLNTIFQMIDDGDNILQENEYDLFHKLLLNADNLNKKTSNDGIIDNNELKTLLKKIEDKEINIDDIKSQSQKTFDPELYSVESLKKRYPEELYTFEHPQTGIIVIKDKNSGRRVLEVINSTSGQVLPNDVNTITEYDSDGKETWYCYRALTNELDAYVGKDGIRHDIIPELLYADITKKKFGIFPTTGKDLEAHLNKLDKYNIEAVMGSYKAISGSSLISDIFTERGLSSEKRAELAKKIIDIYMEARNKYIYETKGFKEALYEAIDKEKDDFGPMSASKIEFLMKQLEDRANIVTPEQMGYDTEKVRPNGKIDNNFSQGSVGDCWLLAAIKTIINNPVTEQILNDQISVDNEGNVTVNLKNVDKSYTFSYKELGENYKLSDGDFDVRALEMAVMKYIDEETIISKYRSLSVGDTPIDGNVSNYAYEILLGKSGFANETLFSQSLVTSGIIDKIKSGKYLIVVGRHSFNQDSESDFTVKDTQNNEHKLYANHAFSVTGADDEFVYIVNPWDTSSTLKVPVEDFVDYFQTASIYSVDDAVEKNKQKYEFGPDAIIYANGMVKIPNNNMKYSSDKEQQVMRREKPSQAELDKIREINTKIYGDDYNINVNEWGDVLLVPINNVS